MSAAGNSAADSKRDASRLQAYRLMMQSYADAEEPLPTAAEELLEQLEVEGLVRATASPQACNPAVFAFPFPPCRRVVASPAVPAKRNAVPFL